MREFRVKKRSDFRSGRGPILKSRYFPLNHTVRSHGFRGPAFNSNSKITVSELHYSLLRNTPMFGQRSSAARYCESRNVRTLGVFRKSRSLRSTTNGRLTRIAAFLIPRSFRALFVSRLPVFSTILAGYKRDLQRPGVENVKKNKKTHACVRTTRVLWRYIYVTRGGGERCCRINVSRYTRYYVCTRYRRARRSFVIHV